MASMKTDPTMSDLLRSLSLLADMNLTASWGWVSAPIPTPSRKVVTTVNHSAEPKSEKLVQPLNPSSTPRSPGLIPPRVTSQRLSRPSLAGVTPPK